MNEAIIGISLAYVALAVLVVLLLVCTRWARWIKVGVVLGISVFYFVTYASLEHLLGWPTAESLPQEFVFLSGYVKEPNEDRGETGNVFVWVAEYDLKKRKVFDMPRAHTLPYSADLHAQVTAALKGLKRGDAQLGRVEHTSGPRLLAPRTWMEERISRIRLDAFPRQELPEK